MIFFDNLDSSLKAWFLKRQRDLPWRHDRTPYRVWLSEIMLQQTQVVTVIDYYLRFTQKFPTVESLAFASEDDVLALWSGLGYYSRARNLHKTAQIIVDTYEGKFPDTATELQKLPGIGSYTAGAILAFAFNKPAAVVDGNIARVFSRLFNDDICWGDGASRKHFEAISHKLAHQAKDVRVWQEGLMELGALICKPTQPDCHVCPFKESCQAFELGRVSELPRTLPKPEKKRLDVVCALIHDEEHIWLEKNQHDSLFKGLYAPPSITIGLFQERDEALNGLLDSLQLSSRSQETVGDCHPGLEPGSRDVPSTLDSRFRGNDNRWITTQRTLTHRNLHLHAKLIPMCSQASPSKHWIPKARLKDLGLSAAIKALLRQAALMALIGIVSACSIKSPSIRYLPATPSPMPALPARQNPFEYAKSLMGQSQATLNTKKYRADCSGTVKAIYDAAGWPLGSTASSEDLYKYIQKNGSLDTRQGKPGDLVFFNSGDKKQLAHVGFVEEILSDGTILFIHHMNGIIIRSRMNLKSPHLQIDPQTQGRLNHILRRGGKKGYTAAQLFVAFGRLS